MSLDLVTQLPVILFLEQSALEKNQQFNDFRSNHLQLEPLMFLFKSLATKTFAGLKTSTPVSHQNLRNEVIHRN